MKFFLTLQASSGYFQIENEKSNGNKPVVTVQNEVKRATKHRSDWRTAQKISIDHRTAPFPLLVANTL